LKTAVYPGSFDPVTYGHLDVLSRAAAMFDKVIIAVLKNNSKTPAFSVEERVEMLKAVTGGMTNVKIDSFTGLLADYCRKVDADIIVKGLRAMSDFESEFQMALTNKQLNPHVETIFLTTNVKYMYLSSSVVREVARHEGDISHFVPQEIRQKVIDKLSLRKGV
jgi:pantetheine-phosphate adenylyltransferase